MYHVYVLFLIITSSGGVTTEQFKTSSFEKCHQLLLDIKRTATNAEVSGICISS